MDNLRPLLWLSLAFVLFLMWQAWNQDYGTPAEPETAEQEVEDPEARPEDVPDAPQFEDEDDPRAAAEDEPEISRSRNRIAASSRSVPTSTNY